jgi:hypothetical protein
MPYVRFLSPPPLTLVHVSPLVMPKRLACLHRLRSRRYNHRGRCVLLGRFDGSVEATWRGREVGVQEVLVASSIHTTGGYKQGNRCVRVHLNTPTRGPLRQSPRFRANHLSFTIRPKVDPQPNDLVDCSVRALVHECGGKGGQRQESEARFETAVETGAGEEAQRPLPCEEDDSKDEIDGLKYWYRFDGWIEGFGDEIPKYLGPEIPFHRGSDLVHCCREDNEPRPVILDKPSHDSGWLMFVGSSGPNVPSNSPSCSTNSYLLPCHNTLMLLSFPRLSHTKFRIQTTDPGRRRKDAVAEAKTNNTG